jgi:glucan biosynthesis protein C
MNEASLVPNKRLHYLDNLKVFLTMLVIVHHVGQAYGPTGGFWQYKSSLHENIPWLGLFFAVNAGFFMGLFFLISGYFLPGSFDRKGSHAVKDKLRRYGIPLLFAALVMVPLEMYFYYINYSGNRPLSFIKYFLNIYLGIGGKPAWVKATIGWPEFNFGHLWFVEQLLVYSLVFFLISILIKKRFTKSNIKNEEKSIGFMPIILISVLIAVASAVVRIWYPQDKWVALLGFIQAEPAHLFQYLVLFTAGIIAYRKNWFSKMRKITGYSSLILGIAMASMVYFINFFPHEVVGKAIWSNWGAYESFLAVFLCFGLIVFFREKMNDTSKLLNYLSENSYAAYIFHFPIVLTIQYSLDKINICGAWGKFLTVSVLSIVITYFVSSIIRKIPYMKRVI